MEKNVEITVKCCTISQQAHSQLWLPENLRHIPDVTHGSHQTSLVSDVISNVFRFLR